MNFDRLTKYIDTLEKCGIPGCEMHVAYEGRVVYSYAAGFSNKEHTRKADFDDMYRLYSCTKVVTSVCAMRLVEEGKLDFEDPVSKYLPEFADITVKTDDEGGFAPAKKVMKIKHLFSMTGGLSYDLSAKPIKEAIEKGARTTRQVVASFAKVPLQFEPGEDYQYSLCHDVLGAVIEVVTGKTLGEYMSELIFEPLGMTSATLDATKVDLDKIPDLYHYDVGLYRAIPQEKRKTNEFQVAEQYESGGAGLLCTGSDYVKFAAALSNGGKSADGYQVLSQKSLDLFKTDLLTEAQRSKFIRTVGKPGYSYGYGVRTLVSKEIGQSLSPIGEFGWDGKGGCYTLIDPQNKIGIYFAMQVAGCGYAYSHVHPTLRNLTYEALEK